MKDYTILGIDTSFDDTAASVVRGTTILSNVLSSQLPLYQEWGGVVPRLARQSHEKNIDAVIALALKRAGHTMEQIDALAVTLGPGLAIALEIGIAKAKELATTYKKPLIAVNHMEGHLLSVIASPNRKQLPITNNQFSIDNSLAVLVSGGHTQFVYVKDIGSYEIVGQTQDDAMGEAFDKVGRMLGLGYPAGALVEKLARDGKNGAVVFPVPMRSVKSSDTSFSGLKTAVSRQIDELKARHDGALTQQDIADVAHGFQQAAITHLCEKARFALDSHTYSSLILGGGVAANQEVRSALRKIAATYRIPLHTPYTKKLCVDNAAMIAVAGYFKLMRGQIVEDINSLDRLPALHL